VRPAIAAELGLSRNIHEARLIRDAERAAPGLDAIVAASTWAAA
jgi:hypothetical protein